MFAESLFTFMLIFFVVKEGNGFTANIMVKFKQSVTCIFIIRLGRHLITSFVYARISDIRLCVDILFCFVWFGFVLFGMLLLTLLVSLRGTFLA